MNFKKLILQYLTGNIPTEKLPHIGIAGIGEGYDTASLWVLAGLEKNEDRLEMEKYIKSSLDELNIQMPGKRDAFIIYAFIISEQIINETKNVIDGVSEILDKTINKYDFFSESKSHLYDSIFFENIYSLHDTYCYALEAQDAGVEWVKGTSNNELAIGIEIDLYNELKEWNRKIKEIYQGSFWIKD